MPPRMHDRATGSANQPGLLAPDTTGMNFYRADPALTDLLRLHLPDALFRHIEPYLDRLGELAGGYLDECARLAKEFGVAESGDLIGITAGLPDLELGTNLFEVHRVP